MRRLVVPFLTVTLAGAAALPAQPAPPRRAEDQVLARVREWLAAIQRSDTAALGRLMTPDYVAVRPEGIQPRAAALARLADNAVRISALTLEPGAHVRVDGPSAMVAYTGHEVGQADTAAVDLRFAALAVWVRQGSRGEWRCAGAQVTVLQPTR